MMWASRMQSREQKKRKRSSWFAAREAMRAGELAGGGAASRPGHRSLARSCLRCRSHVGHSYYHCRHAGLAAAACRGDDEDDEIC